MVDAFDKDEPSRTLGEDVVAEAFGRLVPPMTRQSLRPARLVRLVMQVDAKQIPRAAQRLCQRRPRLEQRRLRNLAIEPEAIARPRGWRQPAGRQQDKHSLLLRRLDHLLEHLHVRHARLLCIRHIVLGEECSIELMADAVGWNRLVVADALVVEWQLDCVEAVA